MDKQRENGAHVLLTNQTATQQSQSYSYWVHFWMAEAEIAPGRRWDHVIPDQELVRRLLRIRSLTTVDRSL